MLLALMKLAVQNVFLRWLELGTHTRPILFSLSRQETADPLRPGHWACGRACIPERGGCWGHNSNSW